MVIFGIAATIIWGGVHYYVGQRLIVGSHVPRPYSYWAWGLIALHASLGPVAGVSRRYLAGESWLFDALQWAAYIGMGFFVLVFLALFFKDLAFWVAKLLGLYDAPDPDRRTMLTSGINLGIFAASGVATGIGYVNATGRPQVDEVDVLVPGLHPDLDGLRIVQISDMHVGPTLKRPFVEMVVGIVNELDADIIAMTGDLIDGTPQDLLPHLEPMATMKSRYGAYFVTGNHENYWDPHAWQAAAPKIGMTTLANEHRLLKIGRGRLLVGGVNDLKTARHIPEDACDPHKAIADAPEHDFSVLLAHQPGTCYEAGPAGWGLQLSGHTHGGQFFPWNFFVGLAHPFNRGLGKWDDMWVYVNRGTGYWGPPLRLAVPSEITVLILRASGR